MTFLYLTHDTLGIELRENKQQNGSYVATATKDHIEW